jgi:hypothetical protein
MNVIARSLPFRIFEGALLCALCSSSRGFARSSSIGINSVRLAWRIAPSLAWHLL